MSFGQFFERIFDLTLPFPAEYILLSFGAACLAFIYSIHEHITDDRYFYLLQSLVCTFISLLLIKIILNFPPHWIAYINLAVKFFLFWIAYLLINVGTYYSKNDFTDRTLTEEEVEKEPLNDLENANGADIQGTFQVD